MGSGLHDKGSLVQTTGISYSGRFCLCIVSPMPPPSFSVPPAFVVATCLQHQQRCRSFVATDEAFVLPDDGTSVPCVPVSSINIVTVFLLLPKELLLFHQVTPHCNSRCVSVAASGVFVLPSKDTSGFLTVAVMLLSSSW